MKQREETYYDPRVEMIRASHMTQALRTLEQIRTVLAGIRDAIRGDSWNHIAAEVQFELERRGVLRNKAAAKRVPRKRTAKGKK